MRSKIYPLFFLFMLLSATSVFEASAQRRDMRAFENLAASVNAGTTGFGLQAATPLHPNLALRGGFSILPIKASYTYEGYGDNSDYFTIPMDAKVEMYNGMILVDFFPMKDSRFHITGGVFFGSDKIITVTGHTTYDEPIEIGDIWIRPDDLGNVSAGIKSRGVKPYLGIGFGRTIPRTRFGFKFELGGLFQGSPEVTTNNPIINQGGLDQPEINDLNKYLNDYFKVYPYLSFQLSYRIF